ncbi:AAA family ATPase [Synechocystis sp. PCC 7338]|uniref:AAA family ATPase n=1 Tax=Synechocystis sp. PCC 7338 TaxID=2732530 RepID=UPI001BB0D00C|nr:AAA family ATPase [Synechocystis sp. PCC 7338]QUS61725.1 AAA family ATPase [Synechocystis sp. PCC 7338]
MAFAKELDIYLRSRFTLIVLITSEEERALQTVKDVCEHSQRPCITWDVADGFQSLTQQKSSLPAAKDPLTALDQIDKVETNALFVLKDFHDCWGNAQFKRKLRSVAQRLKFTKKSMVITCPTGQLPAELKDEAVIIEFPLPKEPELDLVLENLAKTPGVKVNLTKLGREKLVKAALGLTASQSQRVFAKAIVSNGVLDERDIDLVMAEKKQIINESQALEFFSVQETPSDVGGLGLLKDWLRLRERAFTQEAQDYGLPAPKGIALIGIPGTGKSLTAKMIGGLWRLPLLRLDIRALFGSLVGESEARTRKALELAETVAPCILWIDELEKAFSSGGLDGGVSTRVFGTILTWMQEKTAPCFVVATANNISQLPPELLRKGRFDEIFFLDLPTLAERQEIITVHLRKRNRFPQELDIVNLAMASEGYVGAEIEQAIIDGMYVGFNQGREVTTTDILTALKRQVPLSVSQKEVIGNLRDWLREGRAQSASFEEIHQAEQAFVPLQLEI